MKKLNTNAKEAIQTKVVLQINSTPCPGLVFLLQFLGTNAVAQLRTIEL